MSNGKLSLVAADRLERFFDRMERLTDAEFVMVRAIWDDAEASDREMAWRHARRIVKERQLEGTLDDARARVAAWVNNYLPAGYPSSSFGTSGMAEGEIRQLALPPLLDAVAAIITSAELEASEQTLLLEPMTRVFSS